LDNKLIKPELMGEELIKDIDAIKFTGLGAAVWWLGQSGFAIKSREGVVYIDTYLSESLTRKYEKTSKPHIRMTESPMRGHEVTNADVILSTHRHSDHMDPESIPYMMNASPAAKYILPKAHVEHVLAWGLDKERLIPAEADRAIDINGIRVIPQPACHESFDYTEKTGYPHMSYIIKMGGLTFYHSGDTIPYRGMVERLSTNKTDIAFLPINGRDARRHALGTPGNCTIEEALCIAALAGIGVVVPHHYDMFTFNHVDVAQFEEWATEAYPAQKISVMKCGKCNMFDASGK